ncbi:hypothetical protein SCLCIDRAFT_173624 [Scleroderma citrinum Foug A]|uniref:Uncharacterized protein n=1 Tax=Scleroderma citrinum Foug A TaxID=1036808 RepID=A0A0C3B0S4_9AGAM|nr:hypothetical protein SCLCIDRAFT_173624 [Scleroderma citrinum Foug A]
MSFRRWKISIPPLLMVFENFADHGCERVITKFRLAHPTGVLLAYVRVDEKWRGKQQANLSLPTCTLSLCHKTWYQVPPHGSMANGAPDSYGIHVCG